MLTVAVVDAIGKVRHSELALDEAKRTTVDVISHVAVLHAAKSEEQYAIAALDEHQKKHEFISITGSNVVVLPDYEAIRAETQRTLVTFLNATIKAGFILVQSAVAAKNGGHTDYFVQTKRNACRTGESVKEFVSLVRDVDTRTAIQNRLSRLERFISTLWRTCASI
jgi:hypothetical protein